MYKIFIRDNGNYLEKTTDYGVFIVNEDNEDYISWLEEGNTPEPAYTEQELKAIENNKLIQEAKQYLIDTDYKVLPDYDGDTTGIIEARAEARALIRSLEVTNG
jgi:hypothetical protein